MLSTTQLRDAWGPACHMTSTRVVLFGGAPIIVDYRTKEAFTALSQCLENHGYPADRLTTGAYNCRAITGGTGYSLHAFGIAVDINWARNPYQHPAQYAHGLTTDMPAAMVSDILSLRTRSGAQVFGWGGNYSGNKDPMHYEVVCTPADVATGIIGHAPNPSTPDATRPDGGASLTSGVLDMALHWQHPDGHWERTWIDPTTHELKTRWQTINAGPLFGPYAVINTGGLTFEADSLAGSRGADGNFNWSARQLGQGQAKEFVGWYREPTPGVGGAWVGPTDMDG